MRDVKGLSFQEVNALFANPDHLFDWLMKNSLRSPALLDKLPESVQRAYLQQEQQRMRSDAENVRNDIFSAAISTPLAPTAHGIDTPPQSQPNALPAAAVRLQIETGNKPDVISNVRHAEASAKPNLGRRILKRLGLERGNRDNETQPNKRRRVAVVAGVLAVAQFFGPAGSSSNKSNEQP